MHDGEPHGKQGIELVCICNSYVCVYVGQPLVVAASRNHPLFDNVAAVLR